MEFKARKIHIEGSKVLREVCKDVSPDVIGLPVLEHYIGDMIATLKETENGVGLAAPQVGISYKIFIVWVDRKVKFSKPKIFINPEILEIKGSKRTTREGCLSVPNIYAPVTRQQKVKVKYIDENMQEQIKMFKMFEAVVIQHEYDHLFGVEFYDHVNDRDFEKYVKIPLEELKTNQKEYIEKIHCNHKDLLLING